jgi:hypothetical protein
VNDTAGDIASTAHIRLGGNTLDWVETGWLAFRHSDGTRSYCWFTEWGVLGNQFKGQGIGSLPSWAALGDTAQWRLTQASGNTWNMFIDCLSSCPNPGTSKSLGSFTTNNDHGSPMGETVRLGGSNTTMEDDQTNLRYRQSGGTWTSWVNSRCFNDQVSGWQGNHIFSDEYTVTTGSGNCTAP